MRRVVATAVALGTLALTGVLALPAQASTTPVRLAENTASPKADHVKRVCKASAAVKRNGHTIGHLHRGDTFKVIHPVYDNGGLGFEIIGYYGKARGSVNAKGVVRAGAFC